MNQRGQVLPDYVIMTAIIGLVLFVGLDNPIGQLLEAARDYYQRFTFAMGMP